MFAQEIPPVERFPERLLTGQEQAQWDRARALVEQLDNYILMLKLLSINAGLTWLFAQKHGIPMMNPAKLESRVFDLEYNIKRIKRFVRQVEDRKLGLQFTKGDIDIVDPDQEGLSGIPLIIAGVVVLAGLVATLIYYKKEADDIRPRYNNLLKATDKVFCTKGTPETCAEWKAYKVQKGYTKRKSIADKIRDGIGKPVISGAKWGIMIAIPLIALAFMWKHR